MDGTVDRSPPASSGVTDSIPGPGFHNLEQLSPWAATAIASWCWKFEACVPRAHAAQEKPLQ